MLIVFVFFFDLFSFWFSIYLCFSCHFLLSLCCSLSFFVFFVLRFLFLFPISFSMSYMFFWVLNFFFIIWPTRTSSFNRMVPLNRFFICCFFDDYFILIGVLNLACFRFREPTSISCQHATLRRWRPSGSTTISHNSTLLD